MATHYHFVTEIRLTAPVQVIWEVLVKSETWPKWWRWLKTAEVLEEGDGSGHGRKVLNRVGTPLGYNLSYVGTATWVEEPSLLEFESEGELEGRGQFRLTSDESGSTGMTFNWLVITSRWWMNLLAPLARPLFTWNHDRLMTDFARGLAEVTGSTLLDVSHHTVASGEEGFLQLPA